MNPHRNSIQLSPSSLQQFAKVGRFLLFLLPGGTWMFLFVSWLLHRRTGNADH